jgi:hypothetical protein
MLGVATFQVSDPVVVFVLVETDDAAWDGLRCHVPQGVTVGMLKQCAVKWLQPGDGSVGKRTGLASKNSVCY